MVKPPPPREGAPPREGQRIAKLLARAGVASRRDVEQMIAAGRIALGGKTIDTPATLLTSLRGVTVDGQPVREPTPARLFRYHKPPGLLTAARDPAGRPTIYDRLPRDLPRVMPVGRLDLNTEGLLLLTTDGELKRQLELPSTGIPRTYRARTFGPISQEQLEALIEGIEIEGIRYGSIDANLERRTGRNQWIELTLTEGKNREVRRVLEHLGLQVSRLIRTAYGPFPLADLAPGEVDEVRAHDVAAFRASPRGAAPYRPSRHAAPIKPAIGTDGAKPLRPSPVQGEGGARSAQPSGRVRVSTASAGRTDRPASASASASASAAQKERPMPAPDRNELHHRPPRPTAGKPSRPKKPAPAPAAAAAEDLKPVRPKRGAGWAKAKPRPSTRPTKRGAGARKHPSKDRPGGTKR